MIFHTSYQEKYLKTQYPEEARKIDEIINQLKNEEVQKLDKSSSRVSSIPEKERVWESSKPAVDIFQKQKAAENFTSIMKNLKAKLFKDALKEAIHRGTSNA